MQVKMKQLLQQLTFFIPLIIFQKISIMIAINILFLMNDDNKPLERVQELTEELVTEEDSLPSNKEISNQKIRRQKTQEEIKLPANKNSSTQEEINQLKTDLKQAKIAFSEYKIAAVQEIQSLKQQLQNPLSNQLDIFKSSLIEYWKKITKNLNEEFEEILTLGVDSDSQDIINALFFLQEAQEQTKESDAQRILELTQKVSELEAQLKQQENIVQPTLNTTNQEQNKDLQNLWKEVEEVKKWKTELIAMNRNIGILNERINQKESQIHEYSSQLENKQEDIRKLEQKIQQLSQDMLKQKQLSFEQMSSFQMEINNLKEKELDLKAKLQETEFDKERLKSQIERFASDPQPRVLVNEQKSFFVIFLKLIDQVTLALPVYQTCQQLERKSCKQCNCGK